MGIAFLGRVIFIFTMIFMVLTGFFFTSAASASSPGAVVLYKSRENKI
jgi:hypothetical protein